MSCANDKLVSPVQGSWRDPWEPFRREGNVTPEKPVPEKGQAPAQAGNPGEGK